MLVGKAQGHPHMPQSRAPQPSCREKPEALGSTGSLVPSLTSAVLREAVSLQVPASLHYGEALQGSQSKEAGTPSNWGNAGQEQECTGCAPHCSEGTQSPMPPSDRRNKAVLHAYTGLGGSQDWAAGASRYACMIMLCPPVQLMCHSGA